MARRLFLFIPGEKEYALDQNGGCENADKNSMDI